MTVPPGQTFAFLGRNGQCKTTTLRTLPNSIKPDARHVRVLGLDPATRVFEIRRRVG